MGSRPVTVQSIGSTSVSLKRLNYGFNIGKVDELKILTG